MEGFLDSGTSKLCQKLISFKNLYECQKKLVYKPFIISISGRVQTFFTRIFNYLGLFVQRRLFDMGKIENPYLPPQL